MKYLPEEDIKNRALAVFQDLESLHRGLLRRDEQLLDRPLYPLINLVKSLFSDKGFLSEIALELLMKVSKILHLKSQLVLSSFFRESEETEDFPTEHSLIEPLSVELPMNRLLWEKVFLPKLSYEIFERFANEVEAVERGDLTDLLRAMLRVLESEKMVEEVARRLPEYSVEDYIERVKEFLQKKGAFTFEELVCEIDFSSSKGLTQLIYYFLAVLFLCFQGMCSVVQQREFGEIQIFKNT